MKSKASRAASPSAKLKVTKEKSRQRRRMDGATREVGGVGRNAQCEMMGYGIHRSRVFGGVCGGASLGGSTGAQKTRW
jgi:hypothetical protein